MKTISEIYTQYRIMPNLQLHQLRVAAVAKLVTDNFEGELDANSLILAALLHDMGNIVKFDLLYFPQFLEPQGLEHWQKVKDESIAKYGSDSHTANMNIAKEVDVSDTVLTLIDTVSFSKMPETLRSGTIEQKIVEYSDTRVGPFGILGIRERFLDGAKRYAYRYVTKEDADAKYEERTKIGLAIEAYIFSRTRIRPEDINDDSIASLIEGLKHFQVE